MYIRSVDSSTQRQSILGWVLLGLLLGILTTIGGYIFFSSSWGIPGGTSTYNQTYNTGNIPSVGDYLFNNSGNNIQTGGMSGEIGTGITGQDIVYPTGYYDQYNKLLLILNNDQTIGGYIDTELMVSSGFNLITINPAPQENIAPLYNLEGKIDPSIEKLYIVGINNQGAYMFDSIKTNTPFWSFSIDSTKNTIKEGINTYYILGKTKDNQIVMNYTSITTYQGRDFYQTLKNICILDLCSEPSLSIQYDTGSKTITQSSADNKTIIRIIPNTSITRAQKCDNGTIGIDQIKTQGSYFHRTTKPCTYDQQGITQYFIDKQGNRVSSSQININLPSKLQFGNIKYTGPLLNIDPSMGHNFISVNNLTNWSLQDYILKVGSVAERLMFELPDGLFALYTLDTSQLKVINPSGANKTYKIIPKVASRMNKNIVYTLPSTDIGLHDTIVGHFQGVIIESITSCNNPKPNSDPSAKFGILPINDMYDIVGLRNCYQTIVK
ncbi:MAG TPA: hypothetical protein PK048_00845 [Candidatus Absconditabacterales bacterium]|nr:hypothetical protein [Candidatus Absconditabacterales bacterium]